ncbi:MAG: S41 family peptidase [Bacteroidales bacterium]|jgi:carboxyl-terminal processing protease|nr:S41 family peptidase [Bacteroidales bacterium]
MRISIQNRKFLSPSKGDLEGFRKKITHTLLLVTIVAAPIFFTSYDDTKNFEIAKNLDIFYALFQELNAHYVDELDPALLMQHTINKMLEGLDPYTRYIPEADVERARFAIRGEYGGIGALIQSAGDTALVIAELYEHSPAHKAGLLPGDVIVQVNGYDVRRKSNAEVQELVQGQPETSLVIGVQRYGARDMKNITVVRQKINVASVPYSGVLSNNTGYIKLTSFSQNCSDNVKKALQNLKSQGATSLILDLRDNPGGLLVEAVQIVNLFVPQNTKIVYTKGKNALADAQFYTREQPIDTNIPIVVLVNKNSASASEIVSGALQDLDRAVIVGEQTFGKGLVQTRVDLPYNNVMRITNSKYYIPSGRCIQQKDYSNHFGAQARTDTATHIFYTVNKRAVKDAGGIVPDNIVPEDSLQGIVRYIVQQNIVQNFVNQNFTFSDTTSIGRHNFVCSTELWQLFQTFATPQLSTYKSATMQAIETVQTANRSEKMLSNVEIETLKKTVQVQQLQEFERNKAQIQKLLADAVMQRLYFERGKIQYSVASDEYVKEAQKYIADKNLYRQTLKKM